jgi:hypothetical protein
MKGLPLIPNFEPLLLPLLNQFGADMQASHPPQNIKELEFIGKSNLSGKIPSSSPQEKLPQLPKTARRVKMEKKGMKILAEFLKKTGEIPNIMENFLNIFLNYIRQPYSNILNCFPLLALYLKLAPNLFNDYSRLEILTEIGINKLCDETEEKSERRALGGVLLQTIFLVI